MPSRGPRVESVRGRAGATRREVLAWAAAAATGVVACGRRGELTALSAVDAIALMRSGDLAAEDYAAALLARCEESASLNAFQTLDPPRVLEAAREADLKRRRGGEMGPLHGLPIPVKDSVNTKDYPTTGGTPALADFYAPEDAAHLKLLLDAGAIVLGKTSIHELSWGWTSNNLAFGAVRNPYDPDRVPGGSSGGTAAAVASGMAPLGIAEDTQGSIRVPAALCGICGFRPTTGRYPNGGVMPITPLFDQVGPHARTIDDLILFDTVITGDAKPAARTLAGVRLGVARVHYFSGLDAEVESVTDAALRKLDDAGAVLVDAEVPNLATLIGHTTLQIQTFEVMRSLRQYLRDYGAGVSFEELLAQASVDIRESFAQLVLPGGEFAVSPEDYVTARDVVLPALRRTMRDYFSHHGLDAMVFPATMVAAPPIGHDVAIAVNGEPVGIETALARNISPGSTAGIPGLVLPAGLTAGGLPVALELDGPENADRSVLAIGRAVEQVLGRLPPPNSQWL